MRVETTIDLSGGHSTTFEPDCDDGVCSLLIVRKGSTIRIIGLFEQVDDLLDDLMDSYRAARESTQGKD